MFVRKVSTQNVIVENPTSDPPANEAVYPIISQMERAAGFAKRFGSRYIERQNNRTAAGPALPPRSRYSPAARY
jgi:hypothetical protein